MPCYTVKIYFGNYFAFAISTTLYSFNFFYCLYVLCFFSLTGKIIVISNALDVFYKP